MSFDLKLKFRYPHELEVELFFKLKQISELIWELKLSFAHRQRNGGYLSGNRLHYLQLADSCQVQKMSRISALVKGVPKARPTA